MICTYTHHLKLEMANQYVGSALTRNVEITVYQGMVGCTPTNVLWEIPL